MEQLSARPSPSGLRRPAVVALGLGAFLAAALAVDRYVDLTGQLVIGLATIVTLILVSLRVSLERRVQVAVVVAVATCFEVLGSIVWGLYRYRLGNLPLFVPPGHGIVYIAGIALSETGIARRWASRFVSTVIGLAATWGVLGLTGILGRVDVLGAMGVVVFVGFLLTSRSRTVLAGVFVVVAALEILGTAVGTWAWKDAVPGLLLPSGNPPSGAASGYVLFDVAALIAAPYALRVWNALRGCVARGRTGSRSAIRLPGASGLVTTLVSRPSGAAQPIGAVPRRSGQPEAA